MNGLADEGPDLLLAALSESGLAFGDFSAADPSEQPDFDLSLLGPPDLVGIAAAVSYPPPTSSFIIDVSFNPSS